LRRVRLGIEKQRLVWQRVAAKIQAELLHEVNYESSSLAVIKIDLNLRLLRRLKYAIVDSLSRLVITFDKVAVVIYKAGGRMGASQGVVGLGLCNPTHGIRAAELRIFPSVFGIAAIFSYA